MKSRILMGFIFLALTACAGKETPPTSQIIDQCSSAEAALGG